MGANCRCVGRALKGPNFPTLPHQINRQMQHTAFHYLFISSSVDLFSNISLINFPHPCSKQLMWREDTLCHYHFKSRVYREKCSTSTLRSSTEHTYFLQFPPLHYQIFWNFRTAESDKAKFSKFLKKVLFHFYLVIVTIY
jgi:hypothetical protein